MTGTLSLRGLAKVLGVSEMAVRKGRKAGVFSEASVRRDENGRWIVADVTLATKEWRQSGRQVHSSSRRLTPPAAPPTPHGASVAPVPDGDTAAAATSDTTAEIEALLTRVRELRQRQPAPIGMAPGVDADLLGDEPPADSSLVAAQRNAMVERGRKLRLENDEREGLLIEAGKAARQAFEFARALRENVLNVPSRLSAELAAESSSARVYARLDAALRQALEATATALESSPAE